MVRLESTSTLTIIPQMPLLLLNKDSVCLYIREYVYTSLPIAGRCTLVYSCCQKEQIYIWCQTDKIIHQ